jgi:hypothetical protein
MKNWEKFVAKIWMNFWLDVVLNIGNFCFPDTMWHFLIGFFSCAIWFDTITTKFKFDDPFWCA